MRLINKRENNFIVPRHLLPALTIYYYRVIFLQLSKMGHMPQEGVDKIIMVKDRALPPTPDNTKEAKEVPHKVHAFRYHLKGEIKK